MKENRVDIRIDELNKVVCLLARVGSLDIMRNLLVDVLKHYENGKLTVDDIFLNITELKDIHKYELKRLNTNVEKLSKLELNSYVESILHLIDLQLSGFIFIFTFSVYEINGEMYLDRKTLKSDIDKLRDKMLSFTYDKDVKEVNK